MEPNEDAVMNMALFQTEEMFNERVRVAMVKALNTDPTIILTLDSVVNRHVVRFKENLATNIANAIRSAY